MDCHGTLKKYLLSGKRYLDSMHSMISEKGDPSGPAITQKTG